MMNKRGQQLTTSTLILIILGVVVLGVLIIGFTMGWGNLKERVFTGKNNVDIISQSCNAACVTHSTYDFCNKKRELRSDEETLKDVTCYWLAENKPSYGIEPCPEITCNVVFYQENCEPGKVLQTLEGGVLKHTNC